MIMICERCCTPIEESEANVRFAHIDEAHADGGITWVYSYMHAAGCEEPRPAPHELPDRSGWDPSRGIGVHRA